MNGLIDPARPTSAPALPTIAETVQAKLLAILACPHTRSPVEVLPIELAGQTVRQGLIKSTALGTVIGRIDNFQLDFVSDPATSAADLAQIETQIGAGSLPTRVDHVPGSRFVPFGSDAIAYTGARIDLADYACTILENAGSTIRFDTSGATQILFVAHPWSGLVHITCGDAAHTLDLYAPHTAIPRTFHLDQGPGRHTVEITVTGQKSPVSFGVQCLFAGYRAPTDTMVPLRHDRDAKVRGAPFEPAFFDLLAKTPANGLVLDVGGGNRQVDDARYINLDYARYAEPDVIGDATMLPFQDSSIDTVYSTGVFEHIADPAKAGAEIARVLKPGGTAVIGWAFMQPIHSEGHHFYNATPWGVEHAFAALHVKRSWYDTSLAFLVRWGAAVSGLTCVVPDAEINAVCDTLARWDALIPEDKKPYMANGVWFEFEKR